MRRRNKLIESRTWREEREVVNVKVGRLICSAKLDPILVWNGSERNSRLRIHRLYYVHVIITSHVSARTGI